MEFRPIDRRSVVQEVADQLRDAVVAAVARSSQLPSEAELSSALMVSRPTLREALRILETEGIVLRDHRTASLRPDVGTRSMSRPLRSSLDILTRTERITMAEILDLRLAVEACAAERAADVATEDDVAKLASALAAMREPGLTEQEWDERSLAFHVAMVSASHNEAFLLVMVAAREAAADIFERAVLSAAPAGKIPANPTPRLADAQWVESQYEVYHRIFDAIRDGRGADAREHLWNWSKAFGTFFEPVASNRGEVAAGEDEHKAVENSESPASGSPAPRAKSTGGGTRARQDVSKH